MVNLFVTHFSKYFIFGTFGFSYDVALNFQLEKLFVLMF